MVAEGEAQFDPLLNPNVVTLIQEKRFFSRPIQVPGWDLSTIAAQNVYETNQQAGSGDQNPGNTDPVFSGKLLNRWTYRTTLRVSFEWEEDEAAYGRALKAMARAYGVGFARGIGKDLVNGNGTSQPQGILTAAANSSVSNGTAGKLTLTDILNIYFSVNRIYRIGPKCAWLMDDTSYKYVRAAVDNQGHPLLSVEKDFETLMGKPVYVCPSLARGSSPITPGTIICELAAVDFLRGWCTWSHNSLAGSAPSPLLCIAGQADSSKRGLGRRFPCRNRLKHFPSTSIPTTFR